MLPKLDRVKIYYLATGRYIVDEESLQEFERWWREHFAESEDQHKRDIAVIRQTG